MPTKAQAEKPMDLLFALLDEILIRMSEPANYYVRPTEGEAALDNPKWRPRAECGIPSLFPLKKPTRVIVYGAGWKTGSAKRSIKLSNHQIVAANNRPEPEPEDLVVNLHEIGDSDDERMALVMPVVAFLKAGWNRTSLTA
ncbi:MAG TPA: hypothetical protein VK497_03320 [Candidatus Saccharimonadales bacterium]|nr:hypothetical protein [Candidatus Saccharimonadales bacterium]